MKNLIISLALTASMNALAAVECPHKVIEADKAVVVVPIYQARVDYQFDDENKKGTAYVTWGVNEEESRSCFKKIEARYPELKASLGRIRVSAIEAKVFKGESAGQMEVMDMAGGYYMGNTDLIPVSYGAKAEIKKAVARKDALVSLSSDAYFEYAVMEKTVVGEVACLGTGNPNGVINLHTRLGELIKIINSRPSSEKVSRDEVLDQFMTYCVDFSEVDAGSMAEFERASLRKTRMVKGFLKLIGIGKVYKKEKADAASLQLSTFLEY